MKYDKQHIKAIKELNKLFPSAIFGGSFALACQSMLDRDVKDLDVILSYENLSKPELFELLKMSDSDRNVGSSYFESNDGVICQLNKKVQGVDVCIFIYQNCENIKWFNKTIYNNFTPSGYWKDNFDVRIQSFLQIKKVKENYVESWNNYCSDRNRWKENKSIEKHEFDITFINKCEALLTTF